MKKRGYLQKYIIETAVTAVETGTTFPPTHIIARRMDCTKEAVLQVISKLAKADRLWITSHRRVMEVRI